MRRTSCIRTRGKKSTPHRDPADPPRRRANKRKGHGTYANDRPPIISIMSREPGEQRFWVGDHADRRTCHGLLIENLPAGSARLYADEWQSYRGSHPAYATVRHSVREWARDDDGDGQREVHRNTCEGAGAALRTYWRAFQGATSSTCISMWRLRSHSQCERVTPELIRRMCRGDPSQHSGYT